MFMQMMLRNMTAWRLILLKTLSLHLILMLIIMNLSQAGLMKGEKLMAFCN